MHQDKLGMSKEEEVCLLVVSFAFVYLCLGKQDMSALQYGQMKEGHHTDLANERGSSSQPIS